MSDIEMSQSVVLTKQVGPHSAGARGVVVDVYDDGAAFEIQFELDVARVERNALAPGFTEGDEVALTVPVGDCPAGTKGVIVQVAKNLLEVDVPEAPAVLTVRPQDVRWPE